MSNNSERIIRLKEDFNNVYNNYTHPTRVCQVECFKMLVKKNSSNIDKPVVERKALFLEAYANEMTVIINQGELIVGSNWLFGPILSEEEEKIYSNNMPVWLKGHFLYEYEEFLTKGIAGIEERINNIQETEETIKTNKAAFLKSIRAFSIFIRRYGEKAIEMADSTDDTERKAELIVVGENCIWISKNVPTNFWQALQLVWFIQLFLTVETRAYSISFGRLDQYLWPFYDRDIKEGILSSEFALDLIKCFYIKTSEGDDSQNLTVGGIDASGKCVENELSILFIKAMSEVKSRQPSLAVRISSNTSENLWDEALKLSSIGTGTPSYFNDEVLIKSLEVIGIPTERAREYAIIGCYEASPQGDTHALSTAGSFCLPDLLLQYLQSSFNYDSFNSFYNGFKEYVQQEYLSVILPGFQNDRDNIKTMDPNPFESVCLTGCIESGLTAEEGGARYSLFGVDILGLGTVIDSLYVIHELVFENRTHDIEFIKKQLKNNFDDQVFYLTCRRMGGKYGTDSEFTNMLVGDFSDFVSFMVLNNKLENDVRPYPGYYLFVQDVTRFVEATPDGRRRGERVSYGCGGSEFTLGKTPTSILKSISNIKHDLCAAGNPVTLSFNKEQVFTIEGRQMLKQLIQSYFKMGGYHLNIMAVSAETLEEAQKNPEEYEDLLVRISGFSAKFTILDKKLQEAIITRTRYGM